MKPSPFKDDIDAGSSSAVFREFIASVEIPKCRSFDSVAAATELRMTGHLCCEV
jgi:hypothetical protein